jgi:hypothetical protein
MRGSMSSTNLEACPWHSNPPRYLVRTILPFFSPCNHPTIDLSEYGSLYKIANGNHFDDS